MNKFEDKRLRYVRHNENKGGSVARNTGIRLSKGEFIAFLDDDDLWVQTKLEKQLGLIGKTLEIGVVYSGYSVINTSGKTIASFLPSVRTNIFFNLLKKNCVGGCSVAMVRKECFNRVGLFDENLLAGQDWDMWIRLAKHYQFDYIDTPLVLYRIHKKQISANPYAAMQSVERIFKKHSTDLKAATDPKKILGYWHYRFGRIYCECGNIRKGKKEFLKAVINDPYSVTYYVRLFTSFLGLTAYTITRNLMESMLPTSFKSEII
jgi:glycosyltransferase involved in cell wall biosynthesis